MNDHHTAVPPLMATTGLSFGDVEAQARHVIHLLQTQGETALRLVGSTLKLVRAVSGRDMAGVFALLGQANVDVQALIQVVKDELEIHNQ